MPVPDRYPCFFFLCCMLLVAGCASKSIRDGAPPTGSSIPHRLPPDAVPRKEAKSRYGNPATYEVRGVRYQVMQSSYGYKQRGVASWYGNKFHGRKTSNQERYDMHAMTAAHKTLPLPTYVRVRNLRNNKSVVVRVNDRGPFVNNRIIDLSYSAAIKLDMIKEGTSLVEVTAISFDEPPPVARQDVPTRNIKKAPVAVPEVFVQVGAYGNIENANRRFRLLLDSGIKDAFVYDDSNRRPALYRIRIGPIRSVSDYDAVVIKLAGIGILDSHLVTN